MKIGILTHPLTTNYGGILQNFALQRALKELGHEPTTIDYYTTTATKIKVLSFVNRALKNLRGQRVPLRGWPTDKEQHVIAQNTERFIRQYIDTTEKCDFLQLKKVRHNQFDALVVGSDQVWRGDRGHIEKYFFSDFTDLNVPKIAYAASMGVDWWSFSEKDTAVCRELVKNFAGISVREDCAIELCKENLGVDAICTLDPTLLIDRKHYEAVANAVLTDKTEGTAMVYVLDKSAVKKEIVTKATEMLGLSPYYVMADAYFAEVGKKEIDKCIFPPVEEWIKGFMDAEYVITDSFHGMVFSIIFQKPFIAIANNKRGRSRFTSLLGMFGLQNRLVETWEEAEALLQTPIDYKLVQDKLDKRRDESLAFLKKNLK